MSKMSSLCFVVIALFGYANGASLVQSWAEQPRYQEANPGGQVVMSCVVLNKRGECRWERDGKPVGIHAGKYEWAAAGRNDPGDCSLRVFNASLEFDDGVWQCQVTPSEFNSRDSLISEGAQLVVREKPNNIVIQTVGDATGESSLGHEIVASAGDDLELECIATGGNPPARLRWFTGDQEIHSGHTQDDTRPPASGANGIGPKIRTWTSISRLVLPVNKADNGAAVRCVAEHPALGDKPLKAKKFLTIHYPPYVAIETTSLDYLEEGKDTVSLRCLAESNPPPKVWWHKEGVNGVFSPEEQIVISPVTRGSAGTYKCVAENALGLSEPAFVDLDVKFPPSVVSVGPSKVVSAKTHNGTVLTCDAEGNPPPRFQWLQKLPSHEVLVRGHTRQLYIDNVTYDDQGEYVCKAINEINGETRSVQSESISVEVSGIPQVLRFGVPTDVIIESGQEAVLEARFCADPMPKPLWHLGNSANGIILTAGTTHGRFDAEIVRKIKDDCYISTLRVRDAHPSDSSEYELRLTNSHGTDSYQVKLTVRENLSPELLVAIAVVVGCVVTILLLTLFILYAVRAEKCCCLPTPNTNKMTLDAESDKTDVESTHSSNVSAFRGNPQGAEKVVIPPDALYATSTKKIAKQNTVAGNAFVDSSSSHQQMNGRNNHIHQQQLQHSPYIYEPMFNDSKESLRPEYYHQQNFYNNRTVAGSVGSVAHSPSPSNLLVNQSQASNSSSDSATRAANRQNNNVNRNVSYNDLCFPKTSNYGSMKKKKKQRSANVGVDCRLNYAVPSNINTAQIEQGIYGASYTLNHE